ncbi:zinc finger TFIIB-type domain-containing protein [Ignisphaera aggregans DSM 17230]|uniref:Zinc finger TFIIB-type domain-containing protein n=1 Tax=Ignisphaera aggregans (strain DSM 17230 / JCM 13409 / AQ1.S1) TaxID=583356 RepID=E0STV0_IGNAA|nr:zinc finger TFIIB-type domain-containing protein [Ignisphaera aggregans DSM 17230]
MSESIDIKCPYCGAGYRVPRTVTYATCPYCGTTFKLDNPSEKIDHYLFKALIDDQKAFNIIKSFASQQVGAEKDLIDRASFVSSKLFYIPIYLYEARVRALCRDGDKEYHGGESYNQYIVIAIDNPPIALPTDYGFPARMREYFKPTISRNYIYLQPVKDPIAIFEGLKRRDISEAMNEAREACPSSDIKLADESRYIGLAHYPFWQIEYSYKGNIFRAIVDAADGTILYLEYPLNIKNATKALIGVIAGTIIASLIGTTIAIQSNTAFIGGLASFIAFTPALYISLSMLLKRKATYMYNPEEEAEFLPTR